MKTTPYFRNRTLRDRLELKKYLKEIADAINHYHAIEQQYIRVVVEADGETIHNAFPDRTYTKKEKQKDP